MLQWLIDSFLFGELATLYVSPTGIIKPLEGDEPQAPYAKLDILLRVAQYHRAKWLKKEDEILTNDEYVKLHHAWRDDWQSWMNQQAQNE